MFKTLRYLMLLFLIISCSNNDGKMILTGHVKGLKKGTLFLQKIKDSSLVSIDSITINGSSDFSFIEPVLEPEIYYLYVRLENGILKKLLSVTVSLNPKAPSSLQKDFVANY